MAHQLLVADDSVTMQKVVQIAFACEEFAVTTASNGQEALAKAKQIKPAVALIDVGMPGVDGYAVCQALKGDPETANARVMLLASQAVPFDEARATASGADGHVMKPFETQALIDRVKTLLGVSRPTRPAMPARAATPRQRRWRHRPPPRPRSRARPAAPQVAAPPPRSPTGSRSAACLPRPAGIRMPRAAAPPPMAPPGNAQRRWLPDGQTGHGPGMPQAAPVLPAGIRAATDRRAHGAPRPRGLPWPAAAGPAAGMRRCAPLHHWRSREAPPATAAPARDASHGTGAGQPSPAPAAAAAPMPPAPARDPYGLGGRGRRLRRLLQAAAMPPAIPARPRHLRPSTSARRPHRRMGEPAEVAHPGRACAGRARAQAARRNGRVP